MSNLTQIIEQIKTEIKVDANGKGFASIRATARLCGVNDMALHKAFDSAYLEPSKLARTLMEQGFDGADLKSFSKNGVPDLAVSLICSYYAMDAGRYVTEQAKLVCKAFQAIGVRTWMQEITGYQKPSEQPVKQFSTVERADKLIGIKEALVAFDIDLSNPRFKQELQDLALDILGIGQNKLSEPTEQWLGVAERAEQLGYSIGLVTKHRSQLGKFVKSHGLDCKQENRLCNGTQRPINLYLLTTELDDVIKEFMDAKVLKATA